MANDSVKLSKNLLRMKVSEANEHEEILAVCWLALAVRALPRHSESHPETRL